MSPSSDVCASRATGLSAERPRRILVVDDEPDARYLFGSLLRAAGHVVNVVASGKAAVEACRREPVDVVVLDYKMPGMDGYATATALRASGCKARIVLVTAYDVPERSAFETILRKPVTPGDFVAQVAA